MILLTLCVRRIYISGCSMELYAKALEAYSSRSCCSCIGPRVKDLKKASLQFTMFNGNRLPSGRVKSKPCSSYVPVPSVPAERGTLGPKGPIPP